MTGRHCNIADLAEMVIDIPRAPSGKPNYPAAEDLAMSGAYEVG